jgi:hypothetical protein
MGSKVIVGAAVLWLLGTSAADAQWLGSVTGGVNGGAAEQTYPRAALALGWWRENVALELETGIIPLLFESEPGDEVEMVVTVMARVIFGIRPLTNGVTPFVFGGIGVVSYSLTDSEDRFEFGRTHAAISLGGGLMKLMSDRFGLRGEVQYIRALDEVNPPADFRWDHTRLYFWSVSGGLVIRF